MGFSPLAKGRRIPDIGRSSVRQSKIRGFTIHHQAGVNAHGEATRPGRQVSANYWIANDGTIHPNIDENRRAWTTGGPNPAGAASDHRNVTAEVSNSPAGVKNGTWAISPAAQASLERLIGDVFKRHGLGKVKRGTRSGVAVHRDFQSTSCPGPYVMANLSTIIKNAEKHRTATATAPKEGIVSMKRTANTYHQAAQSAPKGKWRTLDVAPASKNRHISFSPRNTNPALVVARAAISGLGHNDYVEFMLYHIKYDPKKGNGPVNGILRHRVYGSGAQTDQALDSFLDMTRAVGAVPAGHRWRIRARASKPGVTVSNLGISVFQ